MITSQGEKEMKFFRNRIEAGRRLASALEDVVEKDAIVLAIPRGGVVVGFEVARILNLPLDIVVPRKIGAPENPELAIGAIAENGIILLDDSLVSQLRVPEGFIKAESENQRLEIERRLKMYRGAVSRPNLKNREVVIVDDGIATGSTMKAALASVRKSGARRIIVAIPVGPPSTIRELEMQADLVVCLHTPSSFYAIGEFYDDFAQTDDEEVKDLLRRAHKKS